MSLRMRLSKRKVPSLLVSRFPVFLTIVLTLLNDQVWKYSSWSGSVTGKLSDVCGLFFFPFLLHDLLLIGFVLCGREKRVSRFGFACLAVLSGLVFTLLKLNSYFSMAWTDFYKDFFGLRIQIINDPSDLWALLALVAGYLYYCYISPGLSEDPQT
jgi:hypothetical protein